LEKALGINCAAGGGSRSVMKAEHGKRVPLAVKIGARYELMMKLKLVADTLKEQRC